MTYTYVLRTAFSAVMRSWRERRSCLPASPGTVVLCAILRAAFLNILTSCSPVRRWSCVAGEVVNTVKQSNTSDGTKWQGVAECCAGSIRKGEAPYT